MKLLSIEIEGLWSYRNRVRLDLNDMPLLVGVGENGSGKSTLLVGAIVAALYGRFQTKTNDESITTDAKQGTVSIEFVVGGATYRVGRSWTRGGGSSGIVMVQDDSHKSGWRPLTEKGSKEVTEYVTGLLGMDYQTATMTWIAEQGQYGKFAGATPADRFRLLSGVFGLDNYQDLHAKANERLTLVEGKLELVSTQLSDIQDGLVGDEDETGSKLSDADVEAEITRSNDSIDTIGQQLAELGATDPMRKTVEARQALELVRTRRTTELERAQATIARATQARDSASERARSARASAEAARTSGLEASANRVAEARSQAEHARAAAEEALAQIAIAESGAPELRRRAAAAREFADAARVRSAAAAAEAAGHESERQARVGDWNRLKEAEAAINSRIAKLEAAAGHSECFTCGQHLDAADAAALIDTQRAELASIAAEKATVRESGHTLGARRDAAIALQAQADSEATAASSEAEKLARELAAVEALIATREMHQITLDTADVTVTRVVDGEARTVAGIESTYSSTIAAAEADEAAALAQATAELAEAEPIVDVNQHPTDEEQRLAAALAAAEAEVSGDAATVAQQRSALEAERGQLRTRVQELTRELARRAEAAKFRREQQERIDALDADFERLTGERDLLTALVKAYHPTGIPAMILTGVIDELNEDVNTSLNRLSRGELSVEIRTQRETASGGAENKITVYVQTATGMRAYETLSGGQKFRVDLAIRTGLARSIARGTGTPIQTFILDEGWGSLDEKGLHSTVETLGRLSEEVNVITVSHIDAVRDSFPARVEVTNVGGASHAEVVR